MTGIGPVPTAPAIKVAIGKPTDIMLMVFMKRESFRTSVTTLVVAFFVPLVVFVGNCHGR
jgi:hypothetical protein